MTTMRTLIALLICATCAWGERTNRADGQEVLSIPVCYWDSCAPVLVRDTEWCEAGLVMCFDTLKIGYYQVDALCIRYSTIFASCDTIPAPRGTHVWQCQHGERWQWHDFIADGGMFGYIFKDYDFKYTNDSLWFTGYYHSKDTTFYWDHWILDRYFMKQRRLSIYPDSFIGPVWEE